jgi:3-oxoacyl-[acyl-carrier protein] reductase
MSRNILITGANGALGLAIAEYFLTQEADCRVFLGVRERRERAEELATRFPDRADLITLEITSPEAWKTALTEIEAKAGALGVLINNAGFHEDALLANMSQDQWSRVLDANLNAVFHGCQAVLPAMMRQRQGAHCEHCLAQRHLLACRADELRRGEGGRDRADAESGEGIRPHGHHGERGMPRLH